MSSDLLYAASRIILQTNQNTSVTRTQMSALYDLVGAREVTFLEGAYRDWQILTLDSTTPAIDALHWVRQQSFVRAAGLSHEVSGLAQALTSAEVYPPIQNPPLGIRPIGPDPLVAKNWGLAKVGAPAVWASGATGSKNITVAVIDSGVDYNHEDLIDNLWRNPRPSTDNDLIGYNFVSNDGLPYDDVYYDFVGLTGHGTHVAGIIGATGNNATGTSGVNPNVSIMALKFLKSNNRGDTADAIRAIAYAVNHGAKVINNSWGGKGYEDILYRAIEVAQKEGVLFTAAAGNASDNNDDPSSAIYPASYALDNIISVTKSDRNDEMPGNSGYGGKSVHLQAPGEEIYSLSPKNTYRTLSGSSMSTPFVTGAAALIWSVRPDWTYLQVKQAILETVTPVKWRPRDTITGGRLNVERAVTRAMTGP